MSHYHKTKKSLGQHFLHERSYIDRILLAINAQPGDTLIEIGPGQGALTLPLLTHHGQLIAIELDDDLIAPLQALADGKGHLTIIHRNVLDVDFSALSPHGKIRLVGNLPYNISTPILFHALESAAAVGDMHFMLQKEVVDRMAAAPGSKTYGRLSVMLQAYCHVEPLFSVPPGAFSPPPKVDSMVVRLIPKSQDTIVIHDREVFADIVRASFAQRRKTLRNALRKIATPQQLDAVGISPGSRAEDIDVDRFIALANTFSNDHVAMNQ